MMCRDSIRSLRVVLAAFGLAAVIAAPPARAQSNPSDPLARPIWMDGAQQTTVLDSLPTRLNRYQLLSFPLIPSPNTVSGIFDELGAYNTSVWRLGHWLPTLSGTSKYQEPNAFTTITPGHGYWLITRDSTTVRYQGTAASADTIELPLLQGPNGAPEWNQLGNPFDFNSAVANWRVVKRDSMFTLGEAASANKIDANMRIWNPDTKQYTASGTIPRGRGFFARVTDRDSSHRWLSWVAGQGPSVGYWSSVAVDSKGIPHIVYYRDGSPGALRYLTRKGNVWISSTLDSVSNQFTGLWTSIALDSLDNPHIAYQAFSFTPTDTRPMYIRRLPNGTFTAPEQIEAGPNNGYLTRIKLFHGVPRVTYVSANDNTVRYAERTIGGWVVEPVSGLGAGNLSLTSGGMGFDITSNGVPHIASVSTQSPYALRYFRKNGSTWVSELVDSLPGGNTGITPSLALDASGTPHISYFDQTNIDLKYARKSGTNWLVETVDATGNTGQFGIINLLKSGEPTVTFLEFASMGVPDRIRFARRMSGSWPIVTVDDVGVSSFFAFIGAALTSSGTPVVSYQGNAGSQQMRYAEFVDANLRLKIPPVAGPVPPIAEALSKPVGAAWALAITPRQGDRSAEPLMLGEAAHGTAIGALRSYVAPAPPDGNALALAVRADDGDRVRDFQNNAATQRWTFQTTGGEGPGEQTLEFTGFDVPGDMRFTLRDPDAGWTREIVPGQSVTIAARPRSLEIEAVRGGAIATRMPGDALQFAYPNPFQASTGLSFTLSRAADIRVDILDITGRRVRTLTRTGASVGEHVLVWDGRDDAGHRAPSGVYLANYRAGDAHGSRRLVRVE